MVFGCSSVVLRGWSSCPGPEFLGPEWHWSFEASYSFGLGFVRVL